MRIIIEGAPGAGKTTIAHLIARLLQESGFEVEYDPPGDIHVHHVDGRCLDSLRRRADPVTVEERQIGRGARHG